MNLKSTAIALAVTIVGVVIGMYVYQKWQEKKAETATK